MTISQTEQNTVFVLTRAGHLGSPNWVTLNNASDLSSYQTTIEISNSSRTILILNVQYEH